MTRSRRGLVAVGTVAGLLLLAAGCNGGETTDEEPTETVVVPSQTATATPNPTQTAEATPATQPASADAPTTEPVGPDTEPPPPLELVGEDYDQIVRSYVAFRTWLFRHPDPELFDEITHPDCECYIQRDLLASYVEEGLHWTGDGPGIVVLDTEVIDDQARNLVILQVVFERPEPSQLIGADGVVHERVEPREPWVEDLTFVRDDPQSPWRLRDFLDRGPAEEASGGA